jgi:hypothetical protein
MPKSLYAKTSLKCAFKKGFKEVLQMCRQKKNVKHKLSNFHLVLSWSVPNFVISSPTMGTSQITENRGIKLEHV